MMLTNSTMRARLFAADSLHMPFHMALQYDAYRQKNIIHPSEVPYCSNPERDGCPQCKGTQFRVWQAEGDLVCVRCGLVVDSHMIDETPEWNTYQDQEQDMCRTGGPVQADGSLAGLRIANDTQLGKHLNRIDRKIHSTASSAKDRAMQTELSDMENVCRNMVRMPEADTRIALDLYRDYRQSRTVRHSVIAQAACAYVACGLGVPLDHFSLYFIPSQPKYQKSLNAAVAAVRDIAKQDPRRFGSVFQHDKNDIFAVARVLIWSSTVPGDFQQKFQLQKMCSKIVAFLTASTSDCDLVNKSPRAVAAAVVSYACDKLRMELPMTKLRPYACKETLKKHKAKLHDAFVDAAKLGKKINQTSEPAEIEHQAKKARCQPQ